jgi:tagatose 6-phosphate kinase
MGGSQLVVTPALRRLVCVSINAAIDKTAAVDRLTPGAIHRPELLSAVPGGKAINVARAAACLGLPATVIPVVGGHAGAWLEEALAARGLPARPVRVAGESRTCLSVLDRSNGELTEFYEAGLVLDEAGLAAAEAAVAAELVADGLAADTGATNPGAADALVVVSGSLPPGAPTDAYARITRVAGAAGARCAVDIGGRALALAAAARPWLVKVNAREAAEATDLPLGGEPEALRAARALRRMGAVIAFVSRGTDGAVVVDETGGAWRVGPPPERGPFVVGSGDSLLAGFAAAIASGASTAEAARRGTAAAVANALRPGQGELNPADVVRIAPRITLEAIPG